MKQYLSILLSIVVSTGAVFGALGDPGYQEELNLNSTYPESWNPKAIDKGNGKYDGAFVWKVDNNLYRRVEDPSDEVFNANTQNITGSNRVRVRTDDNRNFKFETETVPFPYVANQSPADFLTRVDQADPEANQYMPSSKR